MQLLALRFLGGVRKGLQAEAQGCPSLWAHRRAQQRDRWPARAQRSLRPGAVAVGLRTRAAPAAGRRLHVLGRAPLREPGSPDFPRRTRALRDRSARRVPEDFESGRCPMPSGRYYARRPRPDDPRRRTRDPTITPNAERWLEELQDEWSGLPDPIRSVAACVRQMENADGAEGQTPRARGRSGRWLVIHGSLTGERDGRATGTAIMLEEAKPSEIAPLIVRAYGLSDCETNITRLIPGSIAQEIAAEVCVSPYTILGPSCRSSTRSAYAPVASWAHASWTSTACPASVMATIRPSPVAWSLASPSRVVATAGSPRQAVSGSAARGGLDAGERLLGRSQQARERLHDRPADRAVLLDERPELPQRQSLADEIGRGGDRRHARALVD